MNPSYISFWRIVNYTPQLSKADVDTAIEKAFQVWSGASPLTFTKIFEEKADINIAFVQRGGLEAVMLNFAFSG